MLNRRQNAATRFALLVVAFMAANVPAGISARRCRNLPDADEVCVYDVQPRSAGLRGAGSGQERIQLWMSLVCAGSG